MLLRTTINKYRSQENKYGIKHIVIVITLNKASSYTLRFSQDWKMICIDNIFSVLQDPEEVMLNIDKQSLLKKEDID